MDNPLSKYPFSDGYFLTPVPTQNYSVHQLQFNDDKGLPYQIIINHGRLGEEQTFEQFVDQELANLQRQVPAFSLEATVDTPAIGPAKLQVVQQTQRFIHEGIWLSQVCSFIKLPHHPQLNPRQQNIVIISLAAENLSEVQHQHYSRIINSFTPWE